MSKITKKDIHKILEALQEAYEKAGKKMSLAVMCDENGEEILIDNREPKDLN